MNQQQATATYAETAIGPKIPIIEAHHHMWPTDRYNRADLERDISQGHNIVQTVFIDCSANYRTFGPDHLKPVGETEWVRTQQGSDGICAAIVGHTNMYLGSRAGEVLDAHLEAGGSSFKGIRHNVAWDRHPDTNNALRGAPEFALRDPTFQAGTAEVAKRGLVFETWLYLNQLGDMKKLAEAQPEMKIIRTRSPNLPAELTTRRAALRLRACADAPLPLGPPRTTDTAIRSIC